MQQAEVGEAALVAQFEDVVVVAVLARLHREADRSLRGLVAREHLDLDAAVALGPAFAAEPHGQTALELRALGDALLDLPVAGPGEADALAEPCLDAIPRGGASPGPERTLRALQRLLADLLTQRGDQLEQGQRRAVPLAARVGLGRLEQRARGSLARLLGVPVEWIEVRDQVVDRLLQAAADTRVLDPRDAVTSITQHEQGILVLLDLGEAPGLDDRGEHRSLLGDGLRRHEEGCDERERAAADHRATSASTSTSTKTGAKPAFVPSRCAFSKPKNPRGIGAELFARSVV